MTLEEYNFFFKISEEIEKEFWEKAIFIFDTSSILEIYYYSEQSREQIFNNLLPTIKDRLWITSHTNYEYLKNRESIIKKTFSEAYSKLKKEELTETEKLITSLKNNLTGISQKTKNEEIHPFINKTIFNPIFKSIDSLKKEFEVFQMKFNEEVEKREKELKKLEHLDDVYLAVFKHFKITDDYDFRKIENIINGSSIRFENKIPPGFKDAQGKNEKVGIQKFGDLIIWNQIIELAIKLSSPILFVTNDVKEDWWDIEKSSKEKPRPKEDLILEFKLKTGKQFWSYSFSQFLYKAKEILKIDITTKTLEEVDRVSLDISEEKLKDSAAFLYWKDPTSGFYLFSLDCSGGTLLYSDLFLTGSSCLKAIAAVKKYSKFDTRYERKAGDHGYYFKINIPKEIFSKEVLLVSPMYSTPEDRDIAIENCKSFAITARVNQIDLGTVII